MSSFVPTHWIDALIVAELLRRGVTPTEELVTEAAELAADLIHVDPGIVDTVMFAADVIVDGLARAEEHAA